MQRHQGALTDTRAAVFAERVTTATAAPVAADDVHTAVFTLVTEGAVHMALVHICTQDTVVNVVVYDCLIGSYKITGHQYREVAINCHFGHYHYLDA